MIEFNIGNEKLEYPDDIHLYVDFWKRLIPVREAVIKDFIEKYDSDEIITLETMNYGKECILKAFNTFSEIFIQCGVYDFNDNYLYKNKLYKKYINNYDKIISEIEEDIIRLNNEKEEAHIRRELIKDSRFKIRGGGLGVSGAVQGIILAETFNLFTGTFYSAFNFLLNSATNYRIASSKKELHRNAKVPIVTELKKDINNLIFIIASYFPLNFSINREVPDQIINNIDNGIINAQYSKQALIHAILADPFNETPYKYLIYYFNELENDVKLVADYFAIDLSEYLRVLHEVCGYYFQDISLVEIAKDELKKVNMLPIFFDKKFWANSYKEKTILLEFLLILWKNLDKQRSEIEITKFLEHCYTFFEKIYNGELLCYQNLKTINHLIQYYKKENKYNFVKYRDEISDDVKKEILSYFYDGDKNGEIYLFVNTIGYFSLNAFANEYSGDLLLLTNKGVIISNWNNSGRIIKEISFDVFIKSKSDINNINCIDFYAVNYVEKFNMSGITDFSNIVPYINNIVSLISPYYMRNKKRYEIQNNKIEGYSPKVSDYFISGEELEKKENIERSFVYYLLGAVKGDTWCSYKLGVYYGNSKYVSSDYCKAKYWFMRAADEENEYAMKYLKQYRKYFDTIEDVNISYIYSGEEFNTKLMQEKIRAMIEEISEEVIRKENSTDITVGELEATGTMLDFLF